MLIWPCPEMDPTNLKAIKVSEEDTVVVVDVGVYAQSNFTVVDWADVNHIVHVQRQSVHTCIGQMRLLVNRGRPIQTSNLKISSSEQKTTTKRVFYKSAFIRTNSFLNTNSDMRESSTNVVAIFFAHKKKSVKLSSAENRSTTCQAVSPHTSALKRWLMRFWPCLFHNFPHHSHPRWLTFTW